MVGCRRAVRGVIVACFIPLGCTTVEAAREAATHVDAGARAPAFDASLDALETDSAVAHRYDTSIFSFLAANVYHDFPSLDVKEGSKFEIFMNRSIDPTQIDSLRVFGPNGFVFDFINQPFADTGNGYLSNDREPVLWYQALRLGTLEGGRYVLEVTFKDGAKGVHSRELVSNFAQRDFYLSHKDQMTYRPNDGTSPANGTDLKWSTLHDLGGPDAYYIGWISSGTAEAIDGNTARGDNIFIAALSDPQAGLNIGSSVQGTTADPLPAGPQTWQVEILDSNELDHINMIVFTPGQHFVAN